ncbi:hypothetical protein B0H11DRAFT_1931497 [Mycena galericulata]|nr:hypothetical protein B0H11DRAFT_1931497 [Mycena galericulata]
MTFEFSLIRLELVHVVNSVRTYLVNHNTVLQPGFSVSNCVYKLYVPAPAPPKRLAFNATKTLPPPIHPSPPAPEDEEQAKRRKYSLPSTHRGKSTTQRIEKGNRGDTRKQTGIDEKKGTRNGATTNASQKRMGSSGENFTPNPNPNSSPCTKRKGNEKEKEQACAMHPSHTQPLGPRAHETKSRDTLKHVDNDSGSGSARHGFALRRAHPRLPPRCERRVPGNVEGGATSSRQQERHTHFSAQRGG